MGFRTKQSTYNTSFETNLKSDCLNLMDNIQSFVTYPPQPNIFIMQQWKKTFHEK